MIKEYSKQIIGAIAGMIINTAVSIIATKTINYTCNKFKRPYCVLCGGTGKRKTSTDEGVKVIKCSCRHRRIL